MPTSFATGVFGSIEFKASSLNSLPKWTNVLKKIAIEEDLYRICSIDSTRCEDKSYDKWVKFIQQSNYKNMSLGEKLEAVNSFANKWPYKTDMEVWGRSDYWESPAEFLKYSGDCEDYAITKFVSLKKLGVPPQNLRIVVLQDTIRNIAHAVLSVKVNNEYYILDSLINMVVKDDKLKQYIPQYSINDTDRWAHIMPRAIKQFKKSTITSDKVDTNRLLFDSYGE